jgi:N-acyl amino acid synthase of PEP-CTERM/exosortase system
MPEITIGLIVALIRESLAHGVWHWYALMEPALLRLLLRFGVRFRPIGGRIDHHGIRQPAFAGAYELLHEIRENRPDLWEFLTDRGHLALLPEWEKPLNSPFGWVPGLSEEPRDPGSQDFQSLA